jgi:hypothetical protein
MSWRELHPRHIPSNAEVREQQWQIQGLDHQIEAAMASTEGSAQVVIELRQERANRVSFIAPFRRLPIEILCEVAWQCAKQGTKPSVLNQVNEAMRYAVNGFKALWANLYVSILDTETTEKVCDYSE